jgi:hypothetical protein
MQSTASSLFRTDAEQLAALRVPFSALEVKTRDQGGMEFTYYEHHTVQNRILDVFGSGVSLTTGSTMIDPASNFVHVEVLLEVEWVSGKKSKISGWGAAAVMKTGDHFKAAYSDAVKVAMSKLGCGLELYDPKYREALAVRLKEIQDQEAERAFLCCQGCSGEIKGGTRPKPDGTNMDLTAKQVATSTRQRFGKRLCMECAGQTAKLEALQ